MIGIAEFFGELIDNSEFERVVSEAVECLSVLIISINEPFFHYISLAVGRKIPTFFLSEPINLDTFLFLSPPNRTEVRVSIEISGMKRGLTMDNCYGQGRR